MKPQKHSSEQLSSIHPLNIVQGEAPDSVENQGPHWPRTPLVWMGQFSFLRFPTIPPPSLSSGSDFTEAHTDLFPYRLLRHLEAR